MQMRILAVFLLLVVTACNGVIYTRDGVTDGDTFYLAPAALSWDDAVYQSWVAYSLMKSTCQLRIGGDNPARASSFECEFRARQRLENAWDEKKKHDPGLDDRYLDALGDVRYAGFLAEYTAYYFAQKDWVLPEGLRTNEFQRWRREHLRGHQAQTRLTGFWAYREKISNPPGA